MIDVKDLRQLAIDSQTPGVRVELKHAFGEALIELLDERDKLLNVLKAARVVRDNFRHFDTDMSPLMTSTYHADQLIIAILAYYGIKIEEAGE